MASADLAGSGERTVAAADEGITRSRVRQIIACHPASGTRIIYIYTRTVYTRARVHIYTWSAGPFNISQIRVTFSRNRFPGRPLCCICIYILYACYIRASRARKFYSCKIFFITRGMSAAELHYMYMRIIGQAIRFSRLLFIVVRHRPYKSHTMYVPQARGPTIFGTETFTTPPPRLQQRRV